MPLLSTTFLGIAIGLAGWRAWSDARSLHTRPTGRIRQLFRLRPAAEFEGGLVKPHAMGALGLPRIGDDTQIRVELVGSKAEPGGVSGLGVAVLAPAVANAIASGTGRRLRSLPLDPMASA